MASDADPYAILRGALVVWPDKERLAELLSAAGLKVSVGRYSVRLEGDVQFVFNDYSYDPPSATIEADADMPEQLISVAQRVSGALAAHDIAHSFEIYFPSDGSLVDRLHHKWPSAPG